MSVNTDGSPALSFWVFLESLGINVCWLSTPGVWGRCGDPGSAVYPEGLAGTEAEGRGAVFTSSRSFQHLFTGISLQDWGEVGRS